MVGQIGIGSLHVARVSKALDADQKPFGSAICHNGARGMEARLARASARDDFAAPPSPKTMVGCRSSSGNPSMVMASTAAGRCWVRSDTAARRFARP